MLAVSVLAAIALAAGGQLEVACSAAVQQRAIPAGKRPANMRHYLLRGDNRMGRAVAFARVRCPEQLRLTQARKRKAQS